MNLWYSLSLFIAARQLSRTLFADNIPRFEDLLTKNSHKPISIIVPAFNEEDSIVECVKGFLNLHYPAFEVIVVNDGSTDNTVGALVEAYDLQPMLPSLLKAVPSKPVYGAYLSNMHPNLMLVDKQNGGKADAVNAGLNHAQYPLFCSVDADCLLDARALLRSSLRFVEDPTLCAVGGTVRVLNNSDIHSGAVVGSRAPRGWLERFQVIEYARAFLTGRTTFSAFQMLLLISGAFGLFRRDDVVRVGGYRTDTVGEDLELVMRLHRYKRDHKEPYRIQYLVDPICWTQVPSDWRSLMSQRDRWHRGLLESLWLHKDMLFNPKYGRLGWFAVPYYWVYEAIGPIVELAGYLMFLLLGLTHLLDVAHAAAFMLVSVLYGVLVSTASMGIEVFMHSRYRRLGDRLILFSVSVLENLGYRQMLTMIRTVAFFSVFRKRGKWGNVKRSTLTKTST